MIILYDYLKCFLELFNTHPTLYMIFCCWSDSKKMNRIVVFLLIRNGSVTRRTSIVPALIYDII